MSVETFEAGTDARPEVTVTGEAARHLEKQLASRGLSTVRIHLEKSGCTGYKYVIDELTAPPESDVVVDLDNGLKLSMPAGDVPSFRGMVLDYVQEGVNRKLVFNNPNAKDACGCGESFSF